jgi:hypothetical protein
MENAFMTQGRILLNREEIYTISTEAASSRRRRDQPLKIDTKYYPKTNERGGGMNLKVEVQPHEDNATNSNIKESQKRYAFAVF